jgi:thiamine-monophosphate kinase
MPEAPPDGFRHGSARPGTTLADVGESALLDQLVAIAGAAGTPAGPFINADDAAVWSPPPGRDLAISIDALVEDVDFRRSWITPRQLGRRAFTTAASDLAGTAADALCCVATLCVRASELLEDVLEVQRGLCDAAAAVGCAVVGGDVSAIEGPAVIDVCVTGSVPAGGGLSRSSGAVGDAVLVTGVLGRAAAGLRLLMAGERGSTPAEQGWVDAQLEPAARLREGAALAARGVRCGGDISDGLVLDAGRTARASGCAVELWRDHLPVDAALSERFGNDWLELAVAAGEDFELLVTVPEAKLDDLLGAWPAQLARLTRVGSLVAGAGVHMLDRRGGATVPLPAGRAGHFA